MGLNKSKIIALSLLFSTAFFSFTSCEKDDDNNNTQQEESQDVSKTDSTNTNAPTDTTSSNTTSDTTKSEFIELTISGKVGEYTYVDLGLENGTKWATYNVGASKPTEYGDYFAWGETSPKENYEWSTYKWCNGSHDTQIKYCVDSEYGTVDSLTTLLAEDDAATANWGAGWRMPTNEEQRDLIAGCNWKWTDNFNGSGVVGYIGTSKANGNTIFVPAAGYRDGTDLHITNRDAHYGNYWSSSLLIERYSCWAYDIDFRYSDNINWNGGDVRYCGLSVRAVVK